MDYKGYVISVAKGTNVMVINHTGKGSLPKIMEGSFTSAKHAKQVIDKWVDNKPTKE